MSSVDGKATAAPRKKRMEVLVAGRGYCPPLTPNKKEQ